MKCLLLPKFSIESFIHKLSQTETRSYWKSLMILVFSMIK